MGTARTNANIRYQKKAYDDLRIRVRKDSTYNKETLQKIAEDRGMSLNELFITAVIKYIEEN